MKRQCLLIVLMMLFFSGCVSVKTDPESEWHLGLVEGTVVSLAASIDTHEVNVDLNLTFSNLNELKVGTTYTLPTAQDLKVLDLRPGVTAKFNCSLVGTEPAGLRSCSLAVDDND